jgi:predicted alpha/beta hydrolase family esterase
MTTLILPGVGGSEPAHWQSWLEGELADSKRIEQADWNKPVLHTWRLNLDRALLTATEPVWIVAHSFGCLVTMSALGSRVLASKVAGVLLVAPASPERFTLEGFARDIKQPTAEGQAHPPALLSRVLPRAPLGLPIRLIASRTDPWLSFETAEWWATRWGAKLIDLGDAGHINVASGFGAWPQVINELNTLKHNSSAVQQYSQRLRQSAAVASTVVAVIEETDGLIASHTQPIPTISAAQVDVDRIAVHGDALNQFSKKVV